MSDQDRQPDKNGRTEPRRAAHEGEPDGPAGAERRAKPDRRSGAERRRALKRLTPAERFAEADRRSEADRRAGAERRAEAERLTRMGRREAARRGGFGNHRSKWTSRRRLLIAAGALVVVLAVVVPIVVTQTRDGGGQSQGTSADGARSVSSPYDMTEVPATADLKIIKDSKFVSLAIKDASGKLTSYGLDSSLPSVRALETAVMNATRGRRDCGHRRQHDDVCLFGPPDSHVRPGHRPGPGEPRRKDLAAAGRLESPGDQRDHLERVARRHPGAPCTCDRRQMRLERPLGCRWRPGRVQCPGQCCTRSGLRGAAHDLLG